MTQQTCQSHANVNDIGMYSNPLPHHAMSNHIKTQNVNPKITTRTLKNEHDYCKTFMSQQNITTHHDTSHEKYFHV